MLDPERGAGALELNAVGAGSVMAKSPHCMDATGVARL